MIHRSQERMIICLPGPKEGVATADGTRVRSPRAAVFSTIGLLQMEGESHQMEPYSTKSPKVFSIFVELF